MFGLGMPELIIILVMVVLLFGANKLPGIGAGIGKGIKNFKEAVKGKPDEIEITAENVNEEKKGEESPAEGTDEAGEK